MQGKYQDCGNLDIGFMDLVEVNLGLVESVLVLILQHSCSLVFFTKCISNSYFNFEIFRKYYFMPSTF